jgi:hypothetical protein
MKVRKKDDEDALLKEEICKAFNKIIRGDFLLKHGFKAVQKQTEEWIERIEAREGCPTRTESMRINRFLLEDAFLQEIARSGEFKPWLVVARFRASDGPNTEIYAQWRDTNRACRELRVNELYTLSLIPNSSTYPHAPDYIIENCWRRPALLANSMTTGCRDNCGSV